MRREFERQLDSRGHSNIRVIDCEIERVKYRPQRNCVVGFKLGLGDGAHELEQRLYVGAFTASEAKARHEKSIAEVRVETALFAPVSFLPALNVVIWTFPNDRKLLSLSLFADKSLLQISLLGDVVAAYWGEDWEITGISHRISNYFPEHSCCVNARVALRHIESNDRRDWEIIGKMRNDEAGATTHLVMKSLFERVGADVAYARPIMYQPAERIHWQARVPGVTLNSLLAAGSADSSILQRVGRAVAALHGTRIAIPGRTTIGNLVENLIHAQSVITSVRPDCSTTIRRVVELLLDSMETLDPNTSVVSHGDLHSNNILVSPSQIYFVDMDRVALGPPLADLGSFLAELVYRAGAKNQAWQFTQSKLNNVIAAYRERASWPVADDDTAWYTASALIHERALRCVTSLKPGHYDLLADIIATAERIMRGGLTSESVATSFSRTQRANLRP